MTNQEAIKILGQYDVSNIHFYTTDREEIPFTEWSDAIEMAISAIEKQVPKQPKYKEEKRPITVYPYCPVCGNVVVTGDMCCVQCGQKIDWMEGER